LKDREAEYYVGVEVEFKHGMDAVLTVLEEGIEREKVVLSDLSTKEDMHRLMVEKGFQRKSEEEIARMKAERYWLLEEEKAATLKRNEELIELHRARIEEQKLKDEKRAASERRSEVISFSKEDSEAGSARDEL
jgi:hypothetical protein